MYKQWNSYPPTHVSIALMAGTAKQPPKKREVLIAEKQEFIESMPTLTMKLPT